MTDQFTLTRLCELIHASRSATDREVLAEEIANRCRNRPFSVGADTERIFEALLATEGEARATLSRALFQLGRENREAVGQIAMPVVSYLSREEPPTQVKIELGRVLGDAVARDPWVLTPDARATLVDLLADDERLFRHSIAWALELFAHARPSELDRYADELHAYVDDAHPPVAKHACRALANLERYRPQLDRAMGHRIADRLDSDHGSLRTAASIALGAIGTPAATEALSERYRIESDPDVRAHVRHALREATFPAQFEPDARAAVAAVSPGDWLAFETQHSVTRTPRYRGVVREIDTTIGPQSSTWIRLVNPYEGYTLSVTADGADWYGTYSDRRTSDAKAVTVTDAYRLDEDRVALCYALEGDTIEFDIDGPTCEISVAGVDCDGQCRRVWGTDDSGNTVEFRPCNHDPLLACFDEGRCFETTAVTLSPAEGPTWDTL